MENEIKRAEFVEDEHLSYLHDLRNSGIINMFGAVPYIQEEFPELTKSQARDILSYWMKTFSESNDE